MTLKSAVHAGFVLASLQALASPSFAQVEVTAKDFDDGHGGHESAIWKDGRPYWYSDYSKAATKTAPAKKKSEPAGADGNPLPADGPAQAQPPDVDPGPSRGAGSPAEDDPKSAAPSAPGGGSPGAETAAGGASAASQSKSAARAAGSMKRMAGALKGMGPGEPGQEGAGGRGGSAARAAVAGPAGRRPAAAAVSGSESFAAAYGGDAAAMARLGLKVGTGADGRPAILDSSGRPATPAQLEALRTQNPRALERRPDFFGVIPRDRYAGLVAARAQPGGASNPAFQDIGMTSGNRDFVWNKSCTKGLDSCNPLAAGKDEAHYDKNAEVSPETLKKVADADKKPDEILTAEEIGKIYESMQQTLKDMEKDEAAEANATPRKIGHPARLTAEGLQRLVNDGGDWAAKAAPQGGVALAAAVDPAPARSLGFSFTRFIRGERSQSAPLEPSSAEPRRRTARARLAPISLLSLAVLVGAVVVRKRGQRRASGRDDASMEKPS